MDTKLKAAPVKEAAKKTQTAVSGGSDSSLSVIHCKHSFNIIRNGQLIGSFLTQAKAIKFAVKYV